MVDQRRHDIVQLAVDGRDLAADLYPLLSMVRVEESVHLPDAFTLRFDDPHFELFDRGLFDIGVTVEIAFRAESDPFIVTTGEITAVGVEQVNGARHELVLSGLDVTHRLARGPKTCTFVQMSDADIAERIIAGYGWERDIAPTGEIHQYVLQADQTDLAFLRERASRIGFDLWISDGTFYFKPRPDSRTRPPVLRWGENLSKFKVRLTSADHCDEVTVRGWDPVAARRIVGRATEGDQGTDAPAAGQLASRSVQAFGRTTRSAGQYPVSTQAEADALARSLLVRASGGEVVLKGEVAGDPRVGAGAAVQIANVGEKLAGTYRVTSAEHLYGSGTPYVTRFVCGGKDAGTLADLLGTHSGSSELHKPWGGLAVGVVTDCEDPESLSRVKVKFPTLGEDDASTWARVVGAGAGERRGLQCLPDVGDEVIVGFELEDRRRPIVLGGMWNRQAPPPEAVVRGGQVQSWHWRSRSGHSISLVDGDQSELVVRHGDGGCVLRMKQGGQVSMEADTSLVLKAESVEIAGSQEVKVTGKAIRLN